MSKNKGYQELTKHDIYFVNVKNVMNSKGISQNILSKITCLSINTIWFYYHSGMKCVDLYVYQ